MTHSNPLALPPSPRYLWQGIDDSAGGVQRILRSKNDMKKGMTAEDAALGEEEEEDDDEAFEGLLEGDDAMEAYKFGETSGSKLVDRMRKKEERERRASNASRPRSSRP